MSFEDPPRYAALLTKPSDLDPGLVVSEPWFSWFFKVRTLFNNGLSTTVTLAKLTGAGTNGSLTFVNGVLTSKIDPT